MLMLKNLWLSPIRYDCAWLMNRVVSIYVAQATRSRIVRIQKGSHPSAINCVDSPPD
jgi:hypothetical protein